MIWPLPLIWLACAVAGYLYSQQQNIPWPVAMRVLPAALLEVTFFYILGVETLRARLERIRPALFAVLLTLAGAAPYCTATLLLGSFRWQSLALVALLAGAVSFWYILFPHKLITDIVLIIFAAAIVLAKVFHPLYPSPHPKVPLDVLGHLMWVRTGLFAMLSIRRIKGVGFGFWPSAREWKIGTVHFAIFVPVAALTAWAIGFAHLHIPPFGWRQISLRAIAIFFGMLWVTALGEEFLFRGLLQQWLAEWMHSESAGLIGASILFGCVHLWFGKFPNGRFALLAGIAGIFYGLAFLRAKSIRASMVAHALVVTTWRIFFA